MLGETKQQPVSAQRISSFIACKLAGLQVRDMQPGSQTWIAKPSLTNQALGICIFDRVSTLRAALEANPDLQEWVLQRYGNALQAHAQSP